MQCLNQNQPAQASSAISSDQVHGSFACVHGQAALATRAAYVTCLLREESPIVDAVLQLDALLARDADDITIFRQISAKDTLQVGIPVRPVLRHLLHRRTVQLPLCTAQLDLSLETQPGSLGPANHKLLLCFHREVNRCLQLLMRSRQWWTMPVGPSALLPRNHFSFRPWARESVEQNSSSKPDQILS